MCGELGQAHHDGQHQMAGWGSRFRCARLQSDQRWCGVLLTQLPASRFPPRVVDHPCGVNTSGLAPLSDPRCVLGFCRRVVDNAPAQVGARSEESEQQRCSATCMLVGGQQQGPLLNVLQSTQPYALNPLQNVQRLFPLAAGSNATGPLVAPEANLDFTGIKLTDPANATRQWAVVYDTSGALWKYPAELLRYCDLGIGRRVWMMCCRLRLLNVCSCACSSGNLLLS